MINPIDYSISNFISFLDSATQTLVRDHSEIVTFKNGAAIEIRGNSANHVYIIESGVVKLGINGADGSRFNLARLGPGHTFCDTEFFLDHPVIYDATAKTDVVLQKLSRTAIDKLMTKSLVFSKALVSVACVRLETTLAYIGDTLGLSLEVRVAKQILSVSEGVGNANTISLRQVDLAHSLGVSRVSIGKALKGLAQKKFIKIGYGKLEILARQRLTQLIE